MANVASIRRPRRDRRAFGVVLALVAIAAGGWLIDRVPTATDQATAALSAASAARPASGGAHGNEVKRRFDEAVVMLHAQQYEHAVTALHRVLALAPRMPEAHVNMGFALLGLKKPKAARDFFDAATALKSNQANAYYGLALAWEAEGDLALATGAMRSYLHLAPSDERPEHLRRARAALWEWEAARDRAR